MSSRLQLDMRNLSLGRRHLVNAYEVEAGIGVAGKTVWVWSIPERLECEALQKVRYINTLTFTFSFFTIRRGHIRDLEIYVKGHSRSLETEPMDRSYMTYY